MQVNDINKIQKCKYNLKGIPYTFIGYGNSTSGAKKMSANLQLNI